jgi:hypothetical protein
VVPAELKIEMPPVALSGTVTRFATFVPMVKLRLETSGVVASPSGNTVRNPEAVGLTAVTLTTAADAPAGTGNVVPVTCTFTVAAAAIGTLVLTVPAIRVGITGT